MSEASDATISEQATQPAPDTIELQPIPPHIQKMTEFFKKSVEVFADEFCDPDLKTKAAIIEGGVKSGKTSFMASVAFGLQHRLAEQSVQSKIFFTTAGLQQTVGLPGRLPPEPTGIKYDKIPNSTELEGFRGRVIIVLDETSQEAPNPDLWKRYTDLPNSVFLVGIHPHSPYLEEWEKIFPVSTEVISMSMIKKFNETTTAS